MELDHPTWCVPRCCRAAIGGTHKSDPIEAIHGTSRVIAWLQQHPEDKALFALGTAYHAIGAPAIFLPLAETRALLHEASKLVAQAGDGEGI